MASPESSSETSSSAPGPRQKAPLPGEVVVDLEGSGKSLKREFAATVLLVGATLAGFWWFSSSQSAASAGDAAPSLAAPSKSAADAIPVPAKPGWQLTFADEFDGVTLQTDKWIDSYPDGVRTHTNNEQQYYAPDGWKVADGKLQFIAQKRSMGGMPYTSGMVSSYGKFSQKYGWFEMRARFPHGQGMWPAFWLLPVTRRWPPEIDVVEVVGHQPDVALLSTHWGNSAGSRQYQTGKWQGPDFCADFHTFAVEWTPQEVIWYIDGIERHRTMQGVPQEPMYILANLAVGGDLPGMPDATTPFPGVMEIDYIRVYERLPGS